MIRWRITMRGWGDLFYEARTASKAKYRAYLQAREAGFYRGGFRAFIADVTGVRRA